MGHIGQTYLGAWVDGTFILLDNQSALPIAGTFSNLAEGATVALGRNTFIATIGTH